MHSTWDRLLGGGASAGDIRRRVKELHADQETKALVESQSQSATSVESWLSASTWLAESRIEAQRSVYTPEVLEPVTVAMRGLVERVDRVDLGRLPETYFQNAGKVARISVIQAGYRLSEVLLMDLAKSPK